MSKENKGEKSGFSELDWAELPTNEKKRCVYFLALGLGIGLLVDFLWNFNVFK